MTRVALVDDHPLVRLGLGAALVDEGFEVVGKFASAEDLMSALPSLEPDIVVLDVKLSGMSGIAACPLVRSAVPRAIVVVLSTFDDPVVVHGARRAGAHGYFSKGMEPRVLAERLRWLLSDGERRSFPPVALQPLTDRERSVLREIVRGATNAEAARALGIGVETVKDYVSRLCAKFEVSDRGALVRAAGPVATQVLDDPSG
jgi:two-component system, NarL family, nitrate/nitrite response regulator NarL